MQNDKPFGSSMASDMKKISKIEGNRAICIIMVACSKTGDILSLNPFQLRLQDTN